ncbi:FAD-dependent monooxygenase [Streptomyces sp. NPDC058676]|uniref:FAD-dependent monooxygenase n=1 Tax=unclassified Streptomyces TaxID=2593676 RepID=UPI0036677B22
MAQQLNTPVPMADVLVQDAGIVGLAAALGIARHRHRVMVLATGDSAPDPGAGIRLSEHALRALDGLGVGDAVRARCVSIGELRLMEGTTGEQLASVPAAGDGSDACPTTVVARRDLHGILYEACAGNPDVRVRQGAPVDRYEQDGERVTVVLRSGERLVADALVGAGGACSTVHHQLTGTRHHPSTTAYHHAVLPGGRLPDTLHPDALTVWARPRWQVVQCPTGLEGGVDLCVQCTAGAGGTVENRPVTVDQVLGDCAEAGEQVRALLAGGDGWHTWAPCDPPPATRWTDHRVALAGDTDGPALPFALGGWHQTLLDAVLLGGLMDCDPRDFPSAFRAYTARRSAQAQRDRARMLYAVYAGGRHDRPSGPCTTC